MKSPSCLLHPKERANHPSFKFIFFLCISNCLKLYYLIVCLPIKYKLYEGKEFIYLVHCIPPQLVPGT